MAYYLIAAGGTGAKCVNAFVHLVAAGLMPTNDAIQIYFVDADVTNGNRNLTLNAIKFYQEAYNGLNQLGAHLGADCPLFRNQIEYGFDDPKHNWNPLPNNNYTLDKILQVGTLPQGYQSPIGEHGAGLSGGQKQRIAIARALLKRPPILIFDEATSHLDGDTAEAFGETVNQLRGKATIVLISHRLSASLHHVSALDLGRL